MGRGGGGHGGGGHGGGHSFHGGGFHSSSRSHGSSFGSRSSFSGSHYHHHHYYGRSYYYSYPRRYNTTPAGVIVTFIIIAYFMISFLSVFIGALSGFARGSIDEDVLETQAQDYYDDKCSGREDCMLFMVGYSKKGDSEAQYIIYGDDASYIVGDSYKNFFDYYDRNYNEDVGIQIAAAIYDYYFDDLDGMTPITPEEEFDYTCIHDELGWIDSKSYLMDNIEALYSCTGVQMYVCILDYDELPNVNTSASNIKSIVAFVFAAVFIIIVFSLITKSIKKSKKHLEELQQKTEILNKPLNQYGSAGTGNSYSGGSGIGVSPADPINDEPYVPNSNFGTFGMHNDVGPTSGSYKINGINNAPASEDSFKEYNELGGENDSGSDTSYNDIISSDDLTFKSAELKDLEKKYSEDQNISANSSKGFDKDSDDYKLNEKSLDSEFRLNESEYSSYDIKNDNDWNSSL